MGAIRPPVRAAVKAPIKHAETDYDRSFRMYNEFRSGMRIDKLMLDEELIEQPQKYLDAAEQKALAMSYRDEAQAELEREKALADGRVRCELEDPKEAQVKAGIALDEKVREADAEYKRWKLLADNWSTLSFSYELRGKALAKLVDLYNTNYFGQNTGRGARSAAQERIASEVRRRGE